MTTPKKQYVKATTSEVSVDKSIAQIKKLVLEYGCSGFQVSEDYTKGTIGVTFVLNPPGRGHVPVSIPVQIDRVYDAMYKNSPVSWRQRSSTATIKQKRRDQAARTAWRNLHLLVEAALSSVSLGVQTIEEVFMAHTLVVMDDGGTVRMADYLTRTAGALAPGVRALLASPTQESNL